MLKNRSSLSFIFLFLLFQAIIQIAMAQNNFSVRVVDKPEADKWREDLRHMAREMPKYHANLYHTLTREQFDAEIKKLDERIPTLARHQIIVEMMRITARINDGHSNIYPTRDAKIGFRQFPVKMYFFKDGLFIRAATNEKAALVGAKVVRIGKATTEEAHRAVLQLIGKDNEMGANFFAPHLLTIPEILHALGFSDSPDSAEFTIEKQGRQAVVKFEPMGPADIWSGDIDKTLMLKTGWTDWRGGPEESAKVLWLKRIDDKFWFEYLEDSKTVYVQFNEVYNKTDETIEAFSKRLFDFVEANPVERFILDVRHNRGGSGELNKPLLLGIIKSAKINQRGRLFTVIGRSSFSATQFLLNDLEKLTETIFVGEPSGSKGNHYGDSRRITLPNSGITTRVSVYQWLHWSPWDSRQWTAPELTAELTSEDYRLNNDPALKAISDYRPQKPLAAILNEALTEGGAEAAVKRFKEYKADPLHKYAYTEEPLLLAGQRLLNEKKPDQAAILFQLSTEENPHSYRSYFALGEAYARAGRREEALLNFEKSLKLNPKAYEVNQRYAQVKASR
jgi:uncharacterized membrane-anchored protein